MQAPKITVAIGCVDGSEITCTTGEYERAVQFLRTEDHEGSSGPTVVLEVEGAAAFLLLNKLNEGLGTELLLATR